MSIRKIKDTKTLEGVYSYGTHNSATGGHLVWWLRPLTWIINPTSKCQDKSIDEQLKDGVKLFNLQVAYNGKRWYFSHGFALYKEDVIETIAKMRSYATVDNPIYFQLYLDKNFWFTQDEFAFTKLIEDIKKTFNCPYFVMLSAWVEGTNKYLHKSNSKIKWEEKYWVYKQSKSILDKIPLPRRYAKKHNQRFKAECTKNYLMLDFYNI